MEHGLGDRLRWFKGYQAVRVPQRERSAGHVGPERELSRISALRPYLGDLALLVLLQQFHLPFAYRPKWRSVCRTA